MDERTITPAYFINLILYFVTNPASITGDRDNSEMFFASPSGQFYRDMTNPARLSGPRHLDGFIVTPNARPLIRTLQKRMPTLTRTATNQTAGPLCLSGLRSS